MMESGTIIKNMAEENIYMSQQIRCTKDSSSKDRDMDQENIIIQAAIRMRESGPKDYKKGKAPLFFLLVVNMKVAGKMIKPTAKES